MPTGDALHEVPDPVTPAECSTLLDACDGHLLLVCRAQENLERLRNGQPLVGQLLPYVSQGEAEAPGLTIDGTCGLLDPLRAMHERVVIRYANKNM